MEIMVIFGSKIVNLIGKDMDGTFHSNNKPIQNLPLGQKNC